MSIDLTRSFDDQPKLSKFITFDRKLKCPKPGHKAGQILFICVSQLCENETRLACPMCLNDHEGHREAQVMLEDFFSMISTKQNALEPQFRDILLPIPQHSNIQKGIKVRFQAIKEYILHGLDLAEQQYNELVQLQLNSPIAIQTQFSQQLKQIHMELHRLKGKPISYIGNSDYEFLLSFILNNEILQRLDDDRIIREQSVQDITEKINDKLSLIEYQANEFNSKLIKLSEDISVTHQLPQTGQHYQHTPKRSKSAAKSDHLQQSVILKSPPKLLNGANLIYAKQTKLKDNQLAKIVTSYTPQIKREVIVQLTKLSKETDTFLTQLLLNYLEDDYITTNNYLLSKDSTIQMRNGKYPLIKQIGGTQLFYKLWQNWMIDFIIDQLGTIPQMGIGFRIQSFDGPQAQESFILRLKKALSIHRILVWFITEQVEKPKPMILPSLLFAQIAQQQTYISLYCLQQKQSNLIQPSGLVKALISNFSETFQPQYFNQINKGSWDTGLSGQILSERVSSFLNLAKVSYLVEDKETISAQDLENTFIHLVTDYEFFTHQLRIAFKDEKIENLSEFQ